MLRLFTILLILFMNTAEAVRAATQQAQTTTSQQCNTQNLFSNAGLEKFSDNLPSGWTVDSWNQELMQEKYGPSKPGYGDIGLCFESYPGNPIAAITFKIPETEIEPLAQYILKFQYSSTLSKGLKLKIEFLDSQHKKIAEQTVILPETQDHWTEYFRQMLSPVKSKFIQLAFEKKWNSGGYKLDNLTLRPGSLSDFKKEFSLQIPSSVTNIFPVFSWYGPRLWPHFPNKEIFDTDNAYAEYARCNFTKGYEARFGVQRQINVPKDDEALIEINNNSSVWLIHGGDEPASKKFPALAEIHNRVNRLAPDKRYWCNLLPIYGFKSIKEYKKHIQDFIKIVKPKFLTYDFYSLCGKSPNYAKTMFSNLEIVRAECLKNNIEFGVIHLVVGHGPLRSTNDAELRWQAFTSLAYGYRALGWFTYLTEIEYGGWNWHDAVIDRNGNRTRHYSMLQRLNKEILNIGNTLLQLETTDVYNSRPLPPETKDIENAKLIKITGPGEWVLGEFQHIENHESKYFMLANRSFINDYTTSIVLQNGRNKLYEISRFDAEEHQITTKKGKVTITVKKGDGRLFRIQ